MGKLQLFFKDFTFQKGKDIFVNTCKRFFIQLWSITIFAIILIFEVNGISVTDDLEGLLLYVLAIGAFIDFVIVLWKENSKNEGVANLVRAVVWVLLLVYYIYLNLSEIFEQSHIDAFLIGNLSVFTAVTLVLPFVRFWSDNDGDDVPAYNLMFGLIRNQFLIYIVQVIIVSAVLLLMFSISQLFNFDFGGDEVFFSVIIIIYWFTFCLFFVGIPYGDKLYNNSIDEFKVLQKGVKYVLLPLLLIYIIVIFMYTLKIVSEWELPKGMVSYLVSGVMFTYVFSYICLYPTLKVDTKLTFIMCKILPMVMLPLLGLMTVGIIRRVSDYGITPTRLYLITLLLWFYVICIVIFIRNTQRIRWIFTSFALLFLLTSFQPFNYTKICKMVHISQYEKLLEQYGLIMPTDSKEYDKIFRKLPENVQNDIIEKQEYIVKKYGYEK